MSDAPGVRILQLQQAPNHCRGCLQGLESASLLATFLTLPPTIDGWHGLLEEALAARFGARPSPLPDQETLNAAFHTAAAPLGALLGWMQVLQTKAGLPVRQSGRLFGIEPAAARVILAIPTPTSTEKACAQALVWLTDLINAFATGAQASAQLDRSEEILGNLRDSLGENSINPRFIRAAQELDIPILRLPGDVVQFGQASRARRLNSTFTDRTPSISTLLARQKTSAAQLMKQAGLPTPPHFLVSNLSQALSAATSLGYPVVVKPSDLDGGQGVAAGLVNEEEVKAAFLTAETLSKSILVEKHVEGNDYRLVVFNNELIWAVERIPGGVQGDGQHTISELLLIENQNPNRGNSPQHVCIPLVLDEEALALLSRAGLDPGSVPEQGRFIRLRRAANVASGGYPVAVFDKVHPDNRLLAIRAAAALRLDLAGIDLLIPDISRSWLDTGAAICEINAQPQLGAITSSHLYPQILKGLVSGNGRVPVALMLGTPQALFRPQLLARELAARGLRLGWASQHEVVANGHLIHRNPATLFDAGRMFDFCDDVDVVILYANTSQALSSGLPFDRVDVLAVAGMNFAGKDEGRRQAEFTHVLRSLLQSCEGQVLVARESGIAIRNEGSTRFALHTLDSAHLEGGLLSALLEAEQRHRSANTQLAPAGA